MPQDTIRVKMLVKGKRSLWTRQLPNSEPVYRNCEFIFDPDATRYDWVVVYDDLPATKAGERRSLRREKLNCPPGNTLLMTSEPSNIKSYGRAFTRQFGHVLTSQPEWALPHRHRIYSQPALYWFYGTDIDRSYTEMEAHPCLDKTETISTVCSNKQQKHTVHNQRHEFTHALKNHLPQLEIFGRGIRPVKDKSEALDHFKYHIAIENYIGRHHWTEKLSDAFLGCTLPFYYGCPNIVDYFPAESIIPIDINDIEGTAEIIKRAVENNEYEKRLPHIMEARRLVMEEYNLFAVLAREITSRNTDQPPPHGDYYLLSRRALRRRPSVLIVDLYDKLGLRRGERRRLD